MIYKLQGGGVGKYISTEKGKCYGVGCVIMLIIIIILIF